MGIKVRCECGTVMSQCRCMQEHDIKLFRPCMHVEPGTINQEIVGAGTTMQRINIVRDETHLTPVRELDAEYWQALFDDYDERARPAYEAQTKALKEKYGW